MLNMFSCIYIAHLYYFIWKLYARFICPYNLLGWYCGAWYLSSLYILGIDSLVDEQLAKIVSIPYLSLYSSNCFLCCAEDFFNLMQFHLWNLANFSFSFLFFLVQYWSLDIGPRIFYACVLPLEPCCQPANTCCHFLSYWCPIQKVAEVFSLYFLVVISTF
jgi:hypothetical protein